MTAMATLTVIDFETIKKVSDAPLEASHPLGQGSNVWMNVGPQTFSAVRTLFMKSSAGKVGLAVAT